MFTVLVCCSASGVFLPPHVVYKGERLRLPWTQGFDGCTFGCTQSGWMEADQFAKWFEKTFVSHCSKLTGDKILFLDGHHSHISTRLFDAADRNNIYLFKLIPHSSHILQPLDVGVFRTVKAVWKQVLDRYFKENGFKDVTKSMFPAMLKLVFENGFKSENSIVGFKTAGLYPLNYDAISEKLSLGTAFLPSSPSTPSSPLTPLTPSTPLTPLTPSPSVSSITSTPVSTKSKSKKMDPSLYENVLRNVTEYGRSSIATSINSLYSAKYSKPAKVFDNIAFQNGIIMNGQEAREEFDKKQREIEEKKNQVESNKRKRAEKKSEAEKLLADYAEAKKTEPKLTKAAFKRRRISLNQVNNENMDPTQTIPSAQETSSETLNNKFVCYDCSSLLFDKYWKTCIDCDRWICGTCYVGILFNSEQSEVDDFYCSNCK